MEHQIVLKIILTAVGLLTTAARLKQCDNIFRIKGATP